jgi:hypothetical protein
LLATGHQVGDQVGIFCVRLRMARRLKPVLLDWSLPAADVSAVFPKRSHLSAKTRALALALANFLLATFEPHRAGPEGAWSAAARVR